MVDSSSFLSRLLPGAIFAGAAAFAADNADRSEAEPVDLAPAVITGTAGRAAADDVPSDVARLDGEARWRDRGASLGASVEALPGVANIATGPSFGKPVIRGLSGNRVRVLQDGAGVNVQQFGVRHPPNVDPFLAGPIEVVTGAQSILYGSDALGGAINVLPRPVPYAVDEGWRRGLELTHRFSSVNDEHLGAVDFEAGRGDFGLTGAFVARDAGNLETPDAPSFDGSGTQRSDIPRFTGELPFTDYEQKSATLRAGYRWNDREATIRYEGWRDAHNFLLPNGGGIGQELSNDLVQAKLRLPMGARWTLEPAYTFNRSSRESNPGGTPLPVVANPAIEVERWSHTLRVEAKREAGDGGARTVGFEAVREDQESRGPTGLTPGGSVENAALFALQRWERGAFTWQGGLRGELRRTEADPGETADTSLLDRDGDGDVDVDTTNTYGIAAASVGGLYRATEKLSFAVNGARGFRAPTLFELYANGRHGGVAAVQRGDPNLEAETSWSADAQARWRGGRFEATATVYYNAIDNYIFLRDTGATVGGFPEFRYDQADAALYGGDVEMTIRPAEGWTLTGTFEAVRGSFDDGGADLPLLPADTLSLDLEWAPESAGDIEDPYVGATLRRVFAKDAAGPFEPFSQFDANPNFGTASTDAYTLLDLRAGFRAGRLSFNLKVANLTDEPYRDFLDTYKGYALGPGRNIQVSATLAF